MKGGKSPQGYTILEVLIVLAVSGLIFLSAVNFVSGKQNKTAFQTGVNEMASRIQDVIDSVVDGQYSDYPIECHQAGSGISASAVASGTDPTDSNQGKNADCVFLGKVIRADANATNYEIINIGGLRASNIEGDPVTDLSASYPTKIDGLTTQNVTPQSLELVSFKDASSGSTFNGFGFLQNAGNVGGKGSRQLPSIYAAPGGIVNTTPLRGVEVCLTDGERYAKLNIGMSDSQQSVKTTMLGTVACS